jgi:mycothiol synthase
MEAFRELWIMARPLSGPDAALPAVEPPPDLAIRAFRPGTDDEAWVALNAKAFAHHPEQGSMTVADLRERQAEPWFDAAGFFLAWRGDRLAGFHWTKVHPARHGHPEPVGEVYVLGVDPAEQGDGLGKTLTLVGLSHLRDLGLSEVILYVDADNTPAVKVYAKLGFVKRSADVMYKPQVGYKPQADPTSSA